MPADEPRGGHGNARYAREIRHSDVGARVVLRHRLADGVLTDALGVLEEWRDGTLRVRDRDGALHEVAEADVVASKRVPAPPARRGARPRTGGE